MRHFVFFAAVVFAFAVASNTWSQAPQDSDIAERHAVADSQSKTSITQQEARQRAALLHETMHATLQGVHHRYYREDEGLPIPAAMLKEVFAAIEKQNVKLRWLAVEGDVMNPDHKPQNERETQAAQALRSGKDYYEWKNRGWYFRAGPIALENQCLKCHVRNRTSTATRTAGLIISMPCAD